MLAGSEQILAFWFADASGSAEALARRNVVWFSADRDFDHEMRLRFETTLDLADAGACSSWEDDPRGRLALILLFDQFPRNIHRGTQRAFAYDTKALGLCKGGIGAGLDERLTSVERVFFYMPLQHAEAIEAQDLSVNLAERLVEACSPEYRYLFGRSLLHAREHRELIERFGRFPHRNGILGRPSTPAEIAYLESGARRFGQKRP